MVGNGIRNGQFFLWNCHLGIGIRAVRLSCNFREKDLLTFIFEICMNSNFFFILCYRFKNNGCLTDQRTAVKFKDYIYGA